MGIFKLLECELNPSARIAIVTVPTGRDGLQRPGLRLFEWMDKMADLVKALTRPHYT